MEYKGDINDSDDIIHALQTVLHLNKKYLSDVQIPRMCIQIRLLYTLHRENIRLNNANKYIFLKNQKRAFKNSCSNFW